MSNDRIFPSVLSPNSRGNRQSLFCSRKKESYVGGDAKKGTIRRDEVMRTDIAKGMACRKERQA